MAPGDGQEVDRGSVGTAAPATGTARIALGMLFFWLTILCVVLAFIFGVANGLLLLATVFGAGFAWAAGAFSRNFWSA